MIATPLLRCGICAACHKLQGSHAAAQTELARAVSLLGYTLQTVGSDTASEAQRGREEEHREDAAFLRAHGIRLCEDERTNERHP